MPESGRLTGLGARWDKSSIVVNSESSLPRTGQDITQVGDFENPRQKNRYTMSAPLRRTKRARTAAGAAAGARSNTATQDLRGSTNSAWNQFKKLAGGEDGDDENDDTVQVREQKHRMREMLVPSLSLSTNDSDQ